MTLQCLGEWLARLGSIPDEARVCILKGIVQPVKGLAEQYLVCLYRACNSMDVRTQLSDFVAPLVGIVKSSTPAQVDGRWGPMFNCPSIVACSVPIGCPPQPFTSPASI